uniref:Tetratricopeptide repeat domain 4 n=1 Tax=Eptatretus burgeri TaxID=7764 RepID=A0A8C4R1I5_EPTBU
MDLGTMQSDGRQEDAWDAVMDAFQSERYSGGFSREKWEEEFERVPLFMKSVGEEGSSAANNNPELQCIQNMLSDLEFVKERKEEGNEFFRQKQYRQAVEAYSSGIMLSPTNEKPPHCEEHKEHGIVREGRLQESVATTSIHKAKKEKVTAQERDIERKSEKESSDMETDNENCKELLTILHTNRAAANFHLGNFRSALNDIRRATSINPAHIKAIIRGARCCLALECNGEAVAWCDRGLTLLSGSKVESSEKTSLLQIRVKAERLRKEKERDERKTRTKEAALLQALKDRGICLVTHSLVADSEEGADAPEREGNVVLLSGGRLAWSVAFLYPEDDQRDLVVDFHEDTILADQLETILHEPPPWDLNGQYHVSNIRVFFESEDQIWNEVSQQVTLGDVLSHPRFIVKDYLPHLFICPISSPFLKRQRIRKAF